MAVRRTPYNSTPAEPISGPFRTSGWWIPDLAFSALRLSVALLITWHGAQDLFGFLIPPPHRWSAPVPWTDGWLEAVVRLGGGTLLAIGLFTRPTAFVLAAVVVLEQAGASARATDWATAGGELAVLHALVLGCFALTGPGLFSVDALIAGQLARRRRGNTVAMSPWIRRQYRRRELAR